MRRTFRLYPEGGSLFVRAKVWDSLDEMRANTGQGRAAGVCTEWQAWSVTENGRSRRDPCVAEVNLCRQRLGTTVITHEMFHATAAWGRRIGFDWSRLGADDAVNEDEERLAHVHGGLCRQFVERAYAAGLYPTEETP